MQTEQFLGMTFVNLLENNLQQIKMSMFNEIEKRIDTIIRKENNAILCVSRHEVYSIIDEYNDFFQVRENYIEICDNIKDKIKSKEDKDEFVDILKTYFAVGIPEDISITVKAALEKELMVG